MIASRDSGVSLEGDHNIFFANCSLLVSGEWASRNIHRRREADRTLSLKIDFERMCPESRHRNTTNARSSTRTIPRGFSEDEVVPQAENAQNWLACSRRPPPHAAAAHLCSARVYAEARLAVSPRRRASATRRATPGAATRPPHHLQPLLPTVPFAAAP